MGKRKVFLRALFVVGLVAVLSAYGLATEQSANKNQGAAAQPRASQPRAPSSQMAQAMMLVRTNELIGKEVKNTQGQNLGVIYDIVLSPDYQQVAYVALSSSAVISATSKLYAIPWQALHVGPKGEVTMSATKEQFTQASSFTTKNWPSQAETHWLGASAGMTGSSTRSSSTPGSATGQSREAREPSSSTAAGTMAAGHQEIEMRRVTHLTGTEVKNSESQDLGDIEGFAINTSDGRVVYDIISFGAAAAEKYAAVPANAVRIQAQNHVAILNATRQTLDSVAFSPDEFPNLNSPEYMARLSKIFPAAPAGGALGYVPSQAPKTQLIADEQAWSAGGMHGKAFNPTTVKTMTGTVESVGRFKPEGAPAGATGGLRLRVKTSSGQIVTVYAGPISFAEQKDFYVMPGDKITITGSETKIRGRMVVLASELKTDGKTLELRDKSGKPLWAMGAPGGPSPSGTSSRRSSQR
jgi:sporulation protein YlmC with PRC-barrel domain